MLIAGSESRTAPISAAGLREFSERDVISHEKLLSPAPLVKYVLLVSGASCA